MTISGAELTKVLEEGLGPALEALRLQRRRRGVWRGGEVEMRVLLDPKARDPYRGGAFTLEFERSVTGVFGRKLAGVARLPRLLTDEQSVAVLAHRNEVALRLRPPPSDHVAQVPESLRLEYLSPFRQLEALERRFWLRFVTAEHVEGWCVVLRPMMPELVDAARSLDPTTMVFS